MALVDIGSILARLILALRVGKGFGWLTHANNLDLRCSMRRLA